MGNCNCSSSLGCSGDATKTSKLLEHLRHVGKIQRVYSRTWQHYKLRSIGRPRSPHYLAYILVEKNLFLCDTNERLMELILKHPLDLPPKLQTTIRIGRKLKLNADDFYRMLLNVFEAMLFPATHVHSIANDSEAELVIAPWEGLDSAIDTPEQVEVAIRIFPEVLGVRKECNSILYFLAVSRKTLPFVPLVAELMDNLDVLRFDSSYDDENIFRDETTTNTTTNTFPPIQCSNVIYTLLQNPIDGDDENLFEDSCLLVLVDLNKRGLIRKHCVYNAIAEAFRDDPTRNSKRIRWLIDLHPPILSERLYLGEFLVVCSYGGEETSLSRNFRMLLHASVMHYPNEIGFLFHKSMGIMKIEPTIFEFASKIFGKNKMIEVVDKVILECIERDGRTIYSMIIGAATNNDIGLDGLYFLLCRDPTTWMPQGDQ